MQTSSTVSELLPDRLPPYFRPHLGPVIPPVPPRGPLSPGITTSIDVRLQDLKSQMERLERLKSQAGPNSHYPARQIAANEIPFSASGPAAPSLGAPPGSRQRPFSLFERLDVAQEKRSVDQITRVNHYKQNPGFGSPSRFTQNSATTKSAWHSAPVEHQHRQAMTRGSNALEDRYGRNHGADRGWGRG